MEKGKRKSSSGSSTQTCRMYYNQTEVGQQLKAFDKFRNGRCEEIAQEDMDKQGAPRRRMGSIEGVAVNDCFEWKGELHMTGLHCSPMSGIDVMPCPLCTTPDCKVAVSLVDSGMYTANDVNVTSAPYQVVVYSGEGKPPKDQTLSSGNLALIKSSEHNILVRFFKAHPLGESASASGRLFCYHGLYKVKHVVKEPEIIRRPHGPRRRSRPRLVYKFTLERAPGQPEIYVPGEGHFLERFIEHNLEPSSPDRLVA